MNTNICIFGLEIGGTASLGRVRPNWVRKNRNRENSHAWAKKLECCPMKDLVIEPTRKTPEIIFKCNGELHLNGISLPQNVIDFFLPVFSWLEQLKEASPERIVFTIDLVYLDTSSTKAILSMLKMLKKMVPAEDGLEVIWKYEHGDIDMLDQGEVLQRTTKLPFRFTEIEI